jgi:hypothetical protein
MPILFTLQFHSIVSNPCSYFTQRQWCEDFTDPICCPLKLSCPCCQGFGPNILFGQKYVFQSCILPRLNNKLEP